MLGNEGHWLKVDCEVKGLVVTSAVTDEEFNRLSSATVDLLSEDEINPRGVIGKRMTLTMEPEEGEKRYYCGTCISIEYLGRELGEHTGDPLWERAHSYRAELRSWSWFLSKTTNCRIFQKMSVIDIFDKVVGDHGFSDYQKKLSKTHPKHDYVVQYRESDLDFLDRILTQEGVYIFSEMSDNKEELVLADGKSAHSVVDGDDKIPFRYVGEALVGQEHIHQWKRTHSVTSGNFVLDDYNFENPKADLTVKSTKKADHDNDKFEQYDYPGHFREFSDGQELVKNRMAAETFQHHTVMAAGYITNAKVGRLFTLIEHPLKAENQEYLIYRSRQQFRQGGTNEEGFSRECDVNFEAIPSNVEFSAPSAAPWPEISGIHTATVVGKKGEEIWTDKHGRVKVQFHWDREGKKDENSSCWVRCMMPWTGKGWGMIHIPRIGQEVVVQFEEGNPDRPLVVGMLYNAETMPPYKLPDNQTQSGFTSRSTKQGGTDTHHELMFEDKKGEELVRFQSERDYKQIVKNNAEIEIGLEHKKDGNLKQTVHNDKTVTLKEGHLTTTVEKGNLKTTVEKGNMTTEVIAGKENRKSAQTMTYESTQKIVLKCGGSTITLEPAKITIKSVQVEVNGMAQTKVQGGAMLDLASGALIKAGAALIKLN